ncbi:MAG: single-stranded DNA-binding protein [Eubacteriales bacterium]|mgnify:FL=1|nr:single-stranded DNA-binding protein [Eubacteriales bacterium]MDY4898779.1 single-stranded DNA-binding protein [Eubacteriales bacterium]
MANFNFNKVILGGRLTADPELKQTQSGIPVVSFSIAVNRRYQSKDAPQQTDFFNITAWRNTAEFVSKYFRKGSSICVTGSIQNRTWTDQQGQKRYATDIVADEVMFVDSRQENSGAAAQYTPDAYNTPSFSTPAASAPKFEEVKTDDDLPF